MHEKESSLGCASSPAGGWARPPLYRPRGAGSLELAVLRGINVLTGPEHVFTSWHALWRFWTGLQADEPSDVQYKRAFSPLRRACQATATWRGPPLELLDLVAATGAFRQICASVASGGMLWIRGRLCSVGQILLRKLLPDSELFSSVQTRSGPIFLAAHPRCPWQEWSGSLGALGDFAAHRNAPGGHPLTARSCTIFRRWIAIERLSPG